MPGDEDAFKAFLMKAAASSDKKDDPEYQVGPPDTDASTEISFALLGLHP